MDKEYWVIPCNIKSYDVINAFENLDIIDWKQSRNLSEAKVGDIVFIYVSKPVQAIKYKCCITNINKPTSTSDDHSYIIKGDSYANYGNYMELKLIKMFDSDSLTISYLKENGLRGNIQGPSRVLGKLKDYIQTVDSQKDEPNSDLETVGYIEGKPTITYGLKYERNSKLRNQAIKIHGTRCKVCDFDFKEKYGLLGEGFIEIHHCKPMYEIKREIEVNPKTDLVPLCSNCHKMIHRNSKHVLTIEELNNLINN